jgi:hypothetical protein
MDGGGDDSETPQLSFCEARQSNIYFDVDVDVDGGVEWSNIDVCLIARHI